MSHSLLSTSALKQYTCTCPCLVGGSISVVRGVCGHVEDGEAHVTADAETDEEANATHEGCCVTTRHLAGTR